MSIPKYRGSLNGNRNFLGYTGIYRARVENNVDPYRIGRVQVRVPMIHGLADSGGMPVEGLPWASMCAMGAGFGYGSFVVPEVGEYVFVMFEDGDEEKPVYLGSSYGIGTTLPKKYGLKDYYTDWEGKANQSEVPLEGQSEVPDKKVIYKSHKGSVLYIDDRDGQEKIHLETENGQFIELHNSDGRILIHGVADTTVEVDEDGIKVMLSEDNRIYLNETAAVLDVDNENRNVEIDIENKVKSKAIDTIFVEKKVKVVEITK